MSNESTIPQLAPCGWEHCVSWKELNETKKKLAASEALVRELSSILELGRNYLPTGWFNGKDGGFMFRDRYNKALKDAQNHLNPER